MLSGEWAWEHIKDEYGFDTWRMKVPGGWIIRTVECGYHSITSTSTFVPEVQ